jgi:hypothetical protein
MKARNILIPAVLFLAAGCTSFNSGDVLVSRSQLRSMLDARDIRPAAEIRLSWKNFPYQSGIDTIGEGTAIPVKPRPIPVPIGDTAWLKEHVEDIFAEAGLYDAQKGSGTISILLTSYGRWTYGEIFRSFLVDTGYVFIIPATLRVNHQLVVAYNGAGGRASVEEVGQNRTTFQALLFPLYPLFPPGRKEHSLLKNMLWKSAVDVYLKVKRGAVSPVGQEPAPPGKPGEMKPAAPALSGPPVPPDRTWLPKKPAESAPGKTEGSPGIEPDKPDTMWVVPTTQSETVQPEAEIKPEPADRDWINTGTSTYIANPDD